MYATPLTDVPGLEDRTNTSPIRLDVDPWALALRMAERHVTHRDLAGALGQTPARVTAWLQVDRAASVNLATAQRIADALNGSPITLPGGHTLHPSWASRVAGHPPVLVADVCSGFSRERTGSLR